MCRTDQLANATSANSRLWTNVGLMSAHRLRRWTNIKTTLGQQIVFGSVCGHLKSRHNNTNGVLNSYIAISRPAGLMRRNYKTWRWNQTSVAYLWSKCWKRWKTLNQHLSNVFCSLGPQQLYQTAYFFGSISYNLWFYLWWDNNISYTLNTLDGVRRLNVKRHLVNTRR